MLEPYATTPEMHEVLEELITASDRASLQLAANRLEAAFSRADGGRGGVRVRKGAD
jgi:hypothetical protein